MSDPGVVNSQASDRIRYLRAPRSAYVFRKITAPTSAVIQRSFSNALSTSKKRAIERIVKGDAKSLGASGSYSFLLFRTESEPPFMKGGDLVDTRHAFLLICELSEIAVVFKHGAAFDEKLFAKAMLPLTHGESTDLFSGANATYEQIALRNMSVSDKALRNRSFDAADLKIAMSSVGANRSIPKGFRVRTDGAAHTIAPSTSRIGKQGSKATIRDLLRWATELEAEVARSKPSDGFMRHFATPCHLKDLPTGVAPSGILLNLDQITTAIESDSISQLLFRRTRRSEEHVLGEGALQRLLDRARHVLRVETVETTPRVHAVARPPLKTAGYLKINANTITVASRVLDRFLVESADSETQTLTAWVNKAQDFVVVFTDPRYAYFGRHLYYDNNLVSTIDALLAMFRDDSGFAHVTSEKGSPVRGSTAFEKSSIFGLIDSKVARADTVLVCDDLADEWADFIGLSADGAEPSISFYHAKHGKAGLSASSLHDVVAQALKNLAHLNPPAAEIKRKCKSWVGRFYKQDKTHTKIARVRRGGGTRKIAAMFEKVMAHPNAIRKVYLVVSSISKQQLRTELYRMRDGERVEPQVTQLLWLLSAFAGGCKDAGANAYVICRR